MATSTLIKEATKNQDLEVLIKSLATSTLDDLQESDLIDTTEAIAALVDILYEQPSSPPSLYIDLEGVHLSRHGTISILQIFVLPKHRAYLIDVHTLNEEAFSTPGANGNTLRNLLESSSVVKVFFDVRNDSDALYSHFKIDLAGVQDLQLMELATRKSLKKFVNGLARCIERDAPMSLGETQAWKTAKDKGLALFAPERGGSYEVFNERPLSKEIRLYCVQDVQFLPRLWSHYNASLSQNWKLRVHEASKERVALSQTADYLPNGRHKALAPSSWMYLR